ncbi:GNAT family N-acetyltransferase [Oceanicola sp. S124]|uniref:GNAT family N-acetyltransferase n=1 Tax=Oceanicola sp. S124 TaxID=1042378 RepID=UPI0002559CF7|nr:GNAT family N-acetyltransferase [Oceanicola sp. S124]
MPPEALAREAAGNELWILPPAEAPLACMVLTVKPDHLYLGKLAVAETARGQGLARRMMDHAEARARALFLPRLRLQTRIELVENHATFRHLGFVEIARTAHPGYDQPTSLTFEKIL